MIRNRMALVLGVALLAALFSACYEVTTVDLRSDFVITRDVSFAADVQPIFAKSCAISGCHVANGQVPDLSADKAYLSLTTSDYLDLNNPENSELYGLTSGKITPAMPIGGQDPAIAAMMLAWIQQGAKNN